MSGLPEFGMRAVQLELGSAFDDVVGALHDARRDLLTATGGGLLGCTSGRRGAAGGWRLSRWSARTCGQEDRAAQASECGQEPAPGGGVGHFEATSPCNKRATVAYAADTPRRPH